MSHTCHWPGCRRVVPPRMWGCRNHWFTLPKRLRDAIWREYRPGQEIDKNPSKEYLEVADEVQKWCYQYISDQRKAAETTVCMMEDAEEQRDWLADGKD